MEPIIILNGFKKAGILPFNDKVVPREKFEPDALKLCESQNIQSRNPKTNQVDNQPNPKQQSTNR